MKNLFRIWFRMDALSRKKTEHILKYYSPDSPPLTGDKGRKRVIFIVNGHGPIYGLSDRLRGATFTYSCVKELIKEGLYIDFRINFCHPFMLREYLEPNKYDWHIEPSDVCYNSNHTEAINLGSYSRPSVVTPLRNYLKKRIRNSSYDQIHIYANTLDTKIFSQSFNELFRPSAIVQQELDRHQKAMGGNGFINTAFRFMDILGDFNHETPRYMIKDEAKRQEFINRCLSQIELLHQKHPSKSVLVTSDSITFLQAAKERFPYVYTIDGKIEHMAKSNSSSQEIHLKTFVDWLLISQADHIYLLKTGNMYKSRFPLSASIIHNKPFKIIRF